MPSTLVVAVAVVAASQLAVAVVAASQLAVAVVMAAAAAQSVAVAVVVALSVAVAVAAQFEISAARARELAAGPSAAAGRVITAETGRAVVTSVVPGVTMVAAASSPAW